MYIDTHMNFRLHVYVGKYLCLIPLTPLLVPWIHFLRQCAHLDCRTPFNNIQFKGLLDPCVYHLILGILVIFVLDL